MKESHKKFLLKEKETAIREKNYFFAHELNLALCQEFFDVLLHAICEPPPEDSDLKEVEETIEYAFNEYLLVKEQYNTLKRFILMKRKARKILGGA